MERVIVYFQFSGTDKQFFYEKNKGMEVPNTSKKLL